MNPVDGVNCPKCNEFMEIRIGRSVTNQHYMFCKCGEKIEF